MVKPIKCGDEKIDLNDARVVMALTEKEEHILSANEVKDGYLTCNEYIQWHQGYPKDKYIGAFKKLIKIADDAKKKGDKRQVSLEELLSSNKLGASAVMDKILSSDTAGFSNKLAVAMAGTGSEFVMGHGSGGLGFKGTGTGGSGVGGYGKIQGLGTISNPPRPPSRLGGRKPEKKIESVERKYDGRYNNFLKLCKALEFLQSHTSILLKGGPYGNVDITRSLDEGYIPQFKRLERDAAEWNRKGLIKNEHYQWVHETIENELKKIREWKRSNR
jgi:hypothetical protein